MIPPVTESLQKYDDAVNKKVLEEVGMSKTRYRFLFVFEMSAGNATTYYNLKEAIGSRAEVDSAWVSIDHPPIGLIAHLPVLERSELLQKAILARLQVHALERSGGHFDAAFFNSVQTALLLRGFRRRVPSIDSMDHTPELMMKYGEYYGHYPRGRNIKLLAQYRYNLTREIYRQAAFLLPWSSWVKNSIVDYYGIEQGKVFVLPPGVDLRLWQRHSRNGQPAVQGAPIRVLFVGGDFTRKGGDLLLRVAKRESLRSVEFHFVTNSSEEATEGNIFLHRGLAPNSNELRNLYDMADIFALPTKGDLFSIASIEAMAMGLPVVATNVGGVCEIIKDGENGYLIDVDDILALEDRLRRLVADRALRQRLGGNARRWAERRFSLEQNAEKILEFMRHAADEKLMPNGR